MELDITIKAQWFKLIRLCTISKGIWEPSIDVYIGRRDTLTMDLAQLQWNSRANFFSYTYVMGRNMVQAHNPPPRTIVTKWHGIVPLRLELKMGGCIGHNG